jgi:hypothetical protein
MAVLKKCAGLITQPNELLRSEGALDRADNVIVDSDDTIEIRNGFLEYGDSFGLDTDTLNQIFFYKDRLIRHYNSTLQFDSDGSGTFSTFDGSYSALDTGLRMKGLETKGNFYFTTLNGIRKISATSADELTTASGYIENAGIVKAADVLSELVFTDGGFLPPQSKSAYRVLWGKKDVNGNLLLGAPSGREIVTNNSESTVIPEQFTITFAGASETDVAGKYILFSNSTTDYYLWFSNTANSSPPQTSETVARTPLEADVDSLGAAPLSIAAIAGNIIASVGGSVSVEVSTTTVVVINNEEQDVTDASAQSGGITNVTVTTNSQGSVTEGSSANAQVTITVPSEIDTEDFFYQVYRTASVTVTTGLTLDDIDPGDEMNLTFEANITTAEIAAGVVTFEDIVTEDFRVAGAFLYTNPNTGEGILQANERPPIAKDLALFRNSTFYSNTKSRHKLQINLLSVLDFTSGVSDVIIGNSTVTREYVAIGETEIYDITCDTFANTTANSIILANSASNEREYYIWFDKGGGTDPLVVNRTGIRVDIAGLTSAADVSDQLTTVLDLIDDFNVSDNTGSVTVTLAKNGDTTDPTFGTPAPGGAWALLVTTQGDGEDTASQEFLLSSLISVGQSIDETARSLVRVINRDSLSPVNASYLSGPDDLPGIILLESKSISDIAFYLATSDPSVTDNFDPALPQTETISAISVDNPTEITSTSHGLTTGNSVYIYSTDSTPTLLGQYTATVLDPNTFTVPVQVFGVGTSGIWFKTDTESDNEVSPNRLYYSKIDRPEAVPIVNYIDIGAKDKPILRILPLRDSLFILKSDGVFIVTGTTAPNFSSRLLDGTVKVEAADSAVVLNNQIYALASEGVVSITESGVEIISRAIENKIEAFVNSKFPNFSTICFGVSYDYDKSYFIWAPTERTDTVATQCYRFHTITRTWTRWTKEATCGLVDDADIKLHLGSGTRNYVDQERKELDRTDKSDRNFTATIPASSVNENIVNISSITDIDSGDVLVQTQYVTIAQVNRLLRKLDLDSGLDDIDYESSLKMVTGGSLINSLDAINAKLVIDDSSGTVSVRSFSSDFETSQTEFNDLVGELNDLACDTTSKDYFTLSGTIPYEGIITNVSSINNTLTLNSEYPFIEGTIEVYKGISAKIEWSPLDFGQADILKQVREGTFIFDQNNFYSATIGYASDLSQNFQLINFLGRGIGDWGHDPWGDFIWGGDGSEVPERTLIPREKQRCRFIRVKFDHINSRENVRIIGISLEPRALSKRAYR